MERKDKVALELEIKQLLYSAQNKVDLSIEVSDIAKANEYIRGILDTKKIIEKYIK